MVQDHIVLEHMVLGHKLGQNLHKAMRYASEQSLGPS